VPVDYFRPPLVLALSCAGPMSGGWESQRLFALCLTLIVYSGGFRGYVWVRGNIAISAPRNSRAVYISPGRQHKWFLRAGHSLWVSGRVSAWKMSARKAFSSYPAA